MTGRSLTPQTMDQLLTAHASSLHTLDVSTITVSPLFEFFASLSPDVRAQWSTEIQYEPGEIVFGEGDDGDFLALIWSGQIAIIKGQSETLTILGYRGSGEVIGEMAVIEKQSRSATAVALEPSILLHIDRSSFEQLLVANASLAMSMMAMLSARLRSSDHARSMQTQVEQKMKHDLATAGEVQQRFLPEAMQFVRDHRMELSRTPFATFTVCMTMAMKNAQYRKGVTDWLEPVRVLVRPVSEGFFAGELNLSKVPSLRKRLMFRVSILTGVWSEGDHRDWEAIHAWATDLAGKI
ncbi:MAG TPA: cyclic nucleotide-binding domain-containing protein [Aggregatilineaceae bacterium]|nr:cyclic nucleotide-binding domain-containing protein [Aggregatilineaceae bacterium]